ncbi:MAG TPA: LUD domain-containing protein, partial [archaeon]|nr:LUD domain-containing protein [archaeon]
MTAWDKVAEGKSIENAKASLEAHGMNVFVVEDRNAAREKVLELIPRGSEVYNQSSVTLEECGLHKEFEDDSKYDSLKKRVWGENDKEKRAALRRQSVAPEYSVGSCAAVTEDGKL